MVRARGLLSASMLVLLAACADNSFVEMVHVSPLEGYINELTEFRERRNTYFVEDETSPLVQEERASFAGLEYFEPDPSLYFVGDVRFYVQQQTLQMVTTSGNVRDALRVGFVAFRIHGEPYRLQVYRLADGSGEFFLPFTDSTTGTETYGAGRYVDLIPSTPNGPFELDFNRSYNPSCAYGEAEKYVCPVTPAENRLPVRVAAGERGRADVPVQGGG